MQLKRFVGLVDLGILTVVLLAVAMPPREMLASNAMKAPEEQKFALALAEARVIAEPGHAGRTEELARQLGIANYKDWAVEAALDGSKRSKAQPDWWRTKLAASTAYIDRLEVVKALEQGEEAVKACTAAGDAACPSWEKTRMVLYRDHVKACIDAQAYDPKTGRVNDPKKCREAGEGKIRTINIRTTTPR
jgi:hypothetical protein